MKQNGNKILLFVASFLFLITIGLFSIQMGYLLLSNRLQMEYIDNRLFYIINISVVVCLCVGGMLLFTFTRKFKIIAASLASLFIIVNLFLMVQSNKEIQNIISISPDFHNVFSIKKSNLDVGVYYRSYYGIVSRPKALIDYSITGDYHVKWLQDDIAVFTYETVDNNVQAFVGTYGDRNEGMGGSYYYVGPQINGVWQGEEVDVIGKSEGIEVIENGKTAFFEWDKVHQFGTLAIVLEQDNQASWVIGLNKGFEVRSDDSKLSTDSISLYKVTLKDEKPHHLNYVKSNNE